VFNNDFFFFFSLAAPDLLDSEFIDFLKKPDVEVVIHLAEKEGETSCL